MKSWAKLLARAGLVAIALAVLAWIGRAASAGGAASAPHDAGLEAAAVAPPAEAPTSAHPPSIPAASGPRGRASPDAPVFLNDADEDELRRLPGVGPKRATAIVAQRRRVGRFRRIEELLRVKGIGRATLRRWRPLVRLDAAAPMGESDGGAQATATAPRTADTNGTMTSARSL